MKTIWTSLLLTWIGMICFLAMSWYVEFDHTQNTLQMAVKRALMSTMVGYVDRMDFDVYDCLDSFEAHFQQLATKDMEYKIAMSGFFKEPLFMRVEVLARNDTKLKNLLIHIDESMIEELRE